MKIILLQDVDTIGKKYEIKEVKDGYARNFLIPKKMAKSVTKQTLKWLEGERVVMEKEAEDDLKQVQELASKLAGAEVSISVKVGDEGQLFESVNAQKISEKLKEMGFEVKKSQIRLEYPLKEAGEFSVKIALPHNLEPEITVVIIAETTEKEEI